ncbi:hypothetical protein CC86DRAFT_401307 [Ophiobolus disseminans]|uniref:Uncharacterized protein n=1 Tax=Ophiobolus disseminans TaxID=1469910 RepID=A0A6A7AGW5_9PLEO|nr:hypothetical protein CC86DRAFT_401307 [Ophiobolus disseminans]
MPAFTLSSDQHTPRGGSSAGMDPLETKVLNGTTDPDNESTDGDPVLTPPTSPNPRARPSTPPTSPDPLPAPSTPPRRKRSTSTPLYRRFLHEVDMSPTTPPRSPSREKSSSPNKRSESPTKGRSTPVNGRDSPTKQKLEVGLNGFHFTCELPMSKVTPKKNTGGTPKRGTPSPIKMEAMPLDADTDRKSPGKQVPGKAPVGSPLRKAGTPATTASKSPRPAAIDNTNKATPTKVLCGTPSRNAVNGSLKVYTPAKARFGTPLRKVATPDPTKRTGSARRSPTKSLEMASKYAQGPLSGPKTTPHKGLGEGSNKSIAESKNNAHHDAGSPSTRQPLAHKSTTEAPRLKPVREISHDIGTLMANLQTLKHQRGNPAVAKRTGQSNISAPPTPLRQAAKGLEVAPIIRYKANDSTSVTNEAPVLSSPKPSPEVTAEKIIGKANISAPPSPPQAAEIAGTPLPTRAYGSSVNPTDIMAQIITSSPFKSPRMPRPPVNFRSHTTKAPFQYPPLLFPPSEPELIAKPDLPSPHTKLRFSKTFRRVGTDPMVLLAMHNEMDNLKQGLSSSLGLPYTFPSYGPANDFQLPNMASSLTDVTKKSRRKLERTASEISNASNTTTSSISTVRASMLINPKEPDATPKVTHKARWPYVGPSPAQARRKELVVAKKMDAKQVGVVISTDPKPNSRTVRKSVPKPLAKPHNLPKASGANKTPARPRATPSLTRTKPSVTPAKPPFNGGIPQSARTSVFESPGRAPTAKVPASLRKLVLDTPNTIPSHDSRTEPRTQGRRFASATDIADRVAQWNSEDKKRATRSPPKDKVKETIPSKLNEASYTKAKQDGSTTPKSSPTKLSPTRLPLPPSPQYLRPPPAKHLHLNTPNRIAPKPPSLTPRLRIPAPLRKLAPRTPALRQLADPNAYRTPSKEVQSRLDEAIDRKIEEDRRVGW